MKPLTNLLLVCLFALQGSATTVQPPRHFVVVVSPYLKQDERDLVFREITRFILEGAQQSDVAEVYDGDSFGRIARVVIPDGPQFQKNPAARARRLASEIASLKKFLATDVPHAADLDGLIRLPQVLETVGSQLRRPGEEVTVIVVGYPFYRGLNTVDKAFDMTDDLVPTDINLLVTRRQSPFGILQKQKDLDRIAVHFAYVRECFLSDYHRYAVTRFWALFVGGQMGVLSTFVAAPQVAFERAAKNERTVAMEVRIDATDTNAWMKSVRFVPTTKESANARPVPSTRQAKAKEASVEAAVRPAELPPTNQSIALPPAQPQSVEPEAKLAKVVFPETPESKIGIGIAWVTADPDRGSDVDVDLYVTPTGYQEELYYKHTVTADDKAKYFRDIRSVHGVDANGDTNTWQADWEFVELDGTIDLAHTAFWLNVFRGNGSPIRGIVRIARGNRVVTKPFTLAGSAGNGGQDGENRANSPFWHNIDMRDFLAP